MLRERIYNLIKERTLNKFDSEGNQIKITSSDIKKELNKISSNRVYVQLRKLNKYEEINKEKQDKTGRGIYTEKRIGIRAAQYWMVDKSTTLK